MGSDILAVARKECLELFSAQGAIRAKAPQLALFMLVLGLYLPFAGGYSYVDAPPYVLFLYVWFPLCMMLGVVMDSFAGERQRHTLETLLASRLSGRGILFGKILAAVLYAWGSTVLFMAVGLAVSNLVFWHGYVAIFRPDTLSFVLAASLLSYVILASAGVIISMRSYTVRQVNDMLFIAILAAAGTIFALYYYILPPDLRDGITNAMLSGGAAGFEVSAVAVLAVISLALLWAAATIFRRDRLMLE